MALTLADSPNLSLSAGYDPAYEQWKTANAVAGSNQIERGWESAGLGEQANSLSAKARAAYAAGDHQLGASLEQQANDLSAQSEQWAPTVRNLTDINGLGSGVDWAGGALGGIRTSVKPAITGALGTGVGALVGLRAGNPALGARVGGFLGSTLGGYDSEYNEAVAGAMNDPTVRATRTMDEIGNASMVKGVANSALEGMVPFGLTKSLLLGGGKKAAEALAEKKLAGYIGSNVAKDMALEGATEASQSLVGQGTQNHLLNKDITDFDYKQALNEGAAGAIAGGGMGLIGAGGEIAHAKLDAGMGAAKDTVNDIKADPFGKVLDAGVNLAGKAGQKITELEHYLDNREQLKSGKTQDEIDRETYEKVMGKPFTSAADPSGVEESHLPASELVAKRKEQARAEGWDGTGDWLAFSRKQKEERDTQAAAADTDEFLSALEGKKSKSSMMRPTAAETRSAAMKEGVDAVEATKTAAGKSESLANVLVNSGYKENLIKAATTTTARDLDVRKVAGILNWGAEYGFNRVAEVVPAMVKQFGGKASSLFRKAYDAGVSEGLFPRNDEKADLIEAELSKEHKSSKMLADLLVANLRPTARAELERHGVQGSAGYNNAVSKLIGEVRRVVNTGAKGNELTQTGNVKNNKTGLRNKNDDMVMRALFGEDEKNVSAILQGFYSEHLARKTVGLVNREQAEAPVEDYRPEYESALGESGNEARTVEKREYHGEFHNINKSDSLAMLEQAEGELKGMHGTVHRVGMKTALLDQYATKRDTNAEDLSPHQRTKALEGAVIEHWPNLADQKPGGIQPTANDATKRDYKERSEKWQKTVAKYAKILERNMQTLMTSTEDQTDAMPNEFDMVAIKAMRLDRDLDHPNNSPEMGTLAFKLKTGGTFITSAPMLMRKMHRVNGELGDTGSYHADLKGGRVQNASSILMEGITSMLGRDDYFTGEFGYVKSGEMVKLSGTEQFPDNFRVVGSKENGDLITWGDSQSAAKDAREGLQSRNEEVRETGLQKVDFTQAEKLEKLQALKSNDKDFKMFLAKWDQFSQLKYIEVKSGKAELKHAEARVNVAKNWTDKAVAEEKLNKLRNTLYWDSAAGRRQRISYASSLNKWFDHFELGKNFDRKELFPGKADSGTQVDGLAAYDSDKELYRGKRGDINSGNLEMVAQSRVGKSNIGTAPVASREKGDKLGADTRADSGPVKSDTGPLASTEVERDAKPATEAETDALVRLEEARDNVVSLIRKSTDNLLDAIDAMTEVQLRDTSTAINGKITETPRTSYVVSNAAKKETSQSGESIDVRENAGLLKLSAQKLGDLYFDGDAGKGRATLGRLTAAAERIENAISTRKEVLKNGTEGRTGSGATEAGSVTGSGTAATGEGAGETSTPGDSTAGEREAGMVARESKEARVTLPNTSPYSAKDQIKADKANKFIGQGSPRSSTAAYAKAFGAKANVGEYTTADRVFVSAEGARAGRKTVDMVELQKALDAGATILTDDAANRNRPYNVGEREVNDALVANGYTETKPGEWHAPKDSKQKGTRGALASAEDQQAAIDHIVKTLGDSVEKAFVSRFTDGSTGKWTPQATKNIITIALNGDVLSTAFHESFHEFMDILGKHNGTKTLEQIERVAMMPMMQAKLDRLLDGHPEAQAQLKTPDEAAAFMYQFWAAGKLNLGPETKTAFQKFADMIKSVLGLVSKEVRNMHLDEIQTEKLLKAFSNGAMADTSERQAVVDAMNASVEANEAAQVRVGKAQQLLNDTAGKLMFSAEAMLEATDNKYMGEGSAIFHQKAGTAMKGQTLMDATRQQTSVYMNKLENTLMKYEQADLEMARHGLSVGKRPTAKAAAAAYDDLKGYFKDMADYLEKKQVKRLDIINGKPTWVNIDFRKDYWPQVWDIDFLEKNVDAFRQDLLDNHADILAKIADDANAEVKARKGAGENTASQAQIDAGTTQTITPAMIADSLIVRMMHTGGQIDIEEDLNDLGITPMAAAVNRRKLDWLDAEKFDKYKSKDISKIMTTYTVNMVKRAEYQDRLGPGGEVLRDLNDKAILFEMAGKKDKLVKDAESALPAAIESWSKAAAKWHEANPGGEKFPDPYPTLRSVGAGLHRAAVGTEKASADNKAALKHLEQGFKAFQAMEGTLGRDISPNFRQFSSWMVTYQNFTKLSTMLFTSFQDVMGIVANGGEMNDAWNAFVSGIKEIKNSWTDKKDTGRMISRAEMWGAVDAGSFADAVGQAYGSPFMSANARRLSDKFFKYTGAEGWNRGVRAVAAQVAERTILEWKQHGIEKGDPAAKARVERLFGKGFDVASIKLDTDGNLDITDEKNQAAVTRWVLDAVPTTSAAHRPIWGSDPHFQMFIQFKNYTYSFHRILLKGAVEQAKLGNYRPGLVLALGYMPIAIAGGAIKEMLIPGEEPPWMKGGLDGYLSYGFSKAGVLGVPQMYAQNLYDLDPAATFGPTIDQLQNVMSIPLFENHTLLGEGLGALPGGNLLKRAA